MVITGTLRNVIFRNERNGWSVSIFQVPQGKIKAVGVLNPVILNADYELECVQETTRYGQQWTIIRANLVAGNEDFNKFLRKKVSKKIVDRWTQMYGSNLIEHVENGSIGRKEWVNEYKVLSASANMVKLLNDLDVPQAFHTKIIEQFGPSAAEEIKKDPYILMRVRGIGFSRADSYARKIGLPIDHPSRLSQAVLHVLEKEAESGHTWTPTHWVYSKASQLTNFPVQPNIVPPDATVVDDRMMLTRLYEVECRIANKLLKLASTEPKVQLIRQPSVALDSKVCLITGGPGTGKTTLIKEIVESFPPGTCSLLAPTGKAAMRLKSAVGIHASTIHMALYQRDIKPVVIVDEASMIDIHVFDWLLRYVDDTSRVILVGDVDQLPSVGPGNVFNDILSSKRFTVHELRLSHRLSGVISYNCHLIRGGRTDLLVGRDFRWVQTDDERYIQKTILSLAHDAQVLLPTYRGNIGIVNINEKLQDLLNKDGQQVPSTKFRVGDRVIFNENDYNVGVMNGEQGVITGFTDKEIEIDVEGHPTTCKVPKDYNISLAYAISIHKSQGSEYDNVVVAMHPSHSVLLTRNLLYTAVSRARKLLDLIASTQCVRNAVRKTHASRRTNLLQLLIGGKDAVSD